MKYPTEKSDLLENSNLQTGKSNLEVFSEILQDLAETNKNIYVITSDSRGSGKLVPFGMKFPDQHIEVGIAEQNLVGIAAGIAAMGMTTFAVSPACFLTARSLEQIKNDVCYSNNVVKLIGISAGVSYGALGTTHHSLHDFAVLRAINNISIVSPADNYETEEVIKAAIFYDSPIYIRFGKKNMPVNLLNHTLGLDVKKPAFQIGKGRIIKIGNDITFIATGEAVWPALMASEILKSNFGINSTIVSMHTIKPLDTALINEVSKNGKPIITIEEHSVYGGLGEGVASFLLQNGFQNKFKIVGLPDDHTVTGSQLEIFDHYGLSRDGLVNIAKQLIEK
jgi:transketolase